MIGCGGALCGWPCLSLTTQPQIRPPTLASATSLPVKISTTPGNFLAADVSMFLVLALHPCCLHGWRGGQNCLHDVVVAGAAAEVALELATHRLLVELVIVALHHVDGAHHHARRAE